MLKLFADTTKQDLIMNNFVVRSRMPGCNYIRLFPHATAMLIQSPPMTLVRSVKAGTGSVVSKREKKEKKDKGAKKDKKSKKDKGDKAPKNSPKAKASRKKAGKS